MFFWREAWTISLSWEAIDYVVMALSVPMLGGGGLIDWLMPGMGDALHGLGNRVI